MDLSDWKNKLMAHIADDIQVEIKVNRHMLGIITSFKDIRLIVSAGNFKKDYTLKVWPRHCNCYKPEASLKRYIALIRGDKNAPCCTFIVARAWENVRIIS